MFFSCTVQLTYILKTTDPIEIKSAFQDDGGSPIFVLDLFGYFWLSVSTIFLAMSIGKKDTLLKSLWYFHGLLGCGVIAVPALPMIYEEDSKEDDTMWQCVILFWCAQFVPACLLMSKNFGSFQGKASRLNKISTSGVGSQAQ